MYGPTIVSVPDGEHEVIWLVEDRCGNIAECSFMITAKECKSPTAVCLDGISINIANGGSVELWASDINQSSSDNCTTQGGQSIILLYICGHPR